MLNLDSILDNICNNLHPIIQRQDGLYAISYDIYPDETLGTNLLGYYNTNDGSVHFTLSGEWSPGLYTYNIDTERWEAETNVIK